MQLYLFFADDAVGPESKNELYGKQTPITTTPTVVNLLQAMHFALLLTPALE